MRRVLCIAIVSIGLVACASGGAATAAPNDDPARAAASAAAGEPGGVAAESRAPLAAPAARNVIKTGEVALEVDDVAAALAAVRSISDAVGGYVGGSQAGTLDDTATLTLRIPADRFDEVLSRLHELDAKVLNEATREEDVTANVVDLRARIDNLDASEASYRTLAAQATAVDDVLKVQARLDEVRGEIEQMQAQLDNLSDRAALSTLTVTLVPVAAPVETQTAGWDAGAQAGEAVAALLAIGQWLAAVGIWLAIVGLPVVAVGVLLLLVGLWLRGMIRRGAAAGAAPRDG